MVGMEIISQPAGQDAPEGADYVRIEKLPGGRFQYLASVALSPTDAIFNNGPFPTAEVAREEGLRWAEEHGATFIYVEDRS